MTVIRSRNREFKYASLALAALLAACGGGSDNPGTETTPPGTLMLSGVAATGAAIGNRPVEAMCNSGSGSATSGADGSYTISVTDGALPCVLKVTPDAGPALYSLATGDGNAATANISPVTQLVVASLVGTDLDAYFSGFDGAAAEAITSTKIETAVAAVKATLLTAGVDLGSIDVLAGTLTPATSSTTGNAYDQALDALAAKLAAAGTSLAALTTSVVTSSPAAPGFGTASLPAELLLRPAASNCSALRSGTYRMVMPSRQTSLADQSGTLVVDATTLAVTFTDGTHGSWVAHATEACRFVDADDGAEIVVSPAGLLVSRSPNGGGSYSLAIGMPEQSHPLGKFAGDWNLIGLTGINSGNNFTAVAGTATLDAAGAFTTGTWCQNDVTWGLSGTDCKAETVDDLDTLSPNSAGGFDSRSPGESAASGRAFMYQAGGRELLIVAVYDDGSFVLLTKQRSDNLPPVGRISSSWNMALNAQLRAPTAVSLSSNTIVSFDSEAGSWVRTQHSVSGPDYDYPETLFVNKPGPGYSYRPADTATMVNGDSVQVREFSVLGLRGMGVSPVVLPSNKSFMLSVNRP